MEINSSSSSMNQYFSPRQQPSEKIAYGIGQANRDEVSLSDKAKFMQMREQNRQDDISLLNGNEPEDEPSDEAIRVTSTIGRNAAAGNYTRAEAMEIYRSIQNLL
ncbi:hypothetical protein OA92_10175 [Marinomonas sp. SBI22]|jgi:hypothetical protein|uniref:hypothetical protein n=1 Tax=unclassified Marinomonas TaxID=196814 RepID=UPI0005F9ED23|nr:MULTISPECIES: hypothetical protein [unclassified Marinomonas]KJZ16012.1 hypothetical protein TW85_03810 [Marinomonas sp. S3726]KZM43107.1 hypothetical protein OA92_10175 [Marinomonas sp. SBI22]KZM44678.1 hypothetical protein OA91_09600 [Marinomonas sp. SBI8L]